MNNFFKQVDSKIKKIYNFLTKDSQIYFIFKLTLAFSTISLILFVLLIRKNKKLARLYCENIGYLRIIKPDPFKYKQLVNSRQLDKDIIYKVVKKFYSFPSGITNFANNCYINVLMQCLASNPDFILFIKQFLEIHDESNSDLELIQDLQTVLFQINTQKSVVSPRSFINNLNYKFSFEHEQQDSYELYHRLLELFETEDKNHNNPFSMKIKSIYKCDKCGNSFERIDDTLDLSLAPSLEFRSIEKLLFKFYNIPVKISDYICVKCSLNYIFDQVETCLVRGEEVTQNLSISSYLSILLRGNIEEDLEEVISKLDQYCVENNCSNSLNKKDIKKIKTNILKKSRIVKYPDILTIHLIKVFFENDAMTTNKIHVSFPEEMIIDSKKYHLTSFIEHWGLHSYGHYIAYRKLYNKWVKINDHKVNIIEKNEALKVGDPYMLFYRKVDQIN